MNTKKKSQGFSLLELIISLTILAILVGAAVPITRSTVKRQREMELKRNLRDIRQAIDKYKRACDAQQIAPLDRKDPIADNCYPPNMEILVEGTKSPTTNQRLRFLRRMPEDPMTGKSEWGMKSIQDDPKENDGSWGGQNVFDVFSKSPDAALNGTKYRDW
jgi:general secretion pathway protein G